MTSVNLTPLLPTWCNNRPTSYPYQSEVENSISISSRCRSANSWYVTIQLTANAVCYVSSWQVPMNFKLLIHMNLFRACIAIIMAPREQCTGGPLGVVAIAGTSFMGELGAGWLVQPGGPPSSGACPQWAATVVTSCCFIVTQVAQHASMHALAPLWDPGHWTGRPPVQSLQDWELANR